MGNVYVYFGMMMGFCFLVVFPITAMLINANKEKSRMMAAKDADYQEMVEHAIQSRREVSEGLEKLVAEVAQLNQRLTSVEKMLREVE